MAKVIEIQKSRSLHGPWTSVCDFTCLRKGSISPNEPGTAQDFQTFTDQSRYWRILVVDNHGGSCTCFQGVEFYGADDRIAEHLEKYDLQSITDKIIDKGYNTFDRFATAPPEDLRKMVSGDSRIEEVITELSHLRLLVYPFTQLAWLQLPVSMATEGECIPEFSVQSDPEISEKVELVFSGCDVKGSTQTALLPSGSKLPSVATFNNITFCSAGAIDLSVRSVRFPHITLNKPHRIEISAKIKTKQDIAAAFEDIEAMLHEAQISLESPKEEFSVPDIFWV